MRTHVKVWVAAANLHEQRRAPFQRKELLDEALRLFPGTNPLTLSTYASSNVSVSGALPHSFAYVIKTSPGTYRLTKSDDEGLRGKPQWPDESAVDERFWPLWRKWVAWQRGAGAADVEVLAGLEPAAPAATPVVSKSEGSVPERLASYIQSLPDFKLERSPATGHDHMGGIIAEAILQAGINYRNVVVPRIEALRRKHSEARTTSGFAEVLRQVGGSELLDFGGVKPARVEALTRFLLKEGVETEADLRVWLGSEANLARLRQLPGVGPKTADYLQILVGLDTSAIDRHLALFLEQAGVAVTTYDERKSIIHAAAGLLGVDRAVLDYSIWLYMSDCAAGGRSNRPDRSDEDDLTEDEAEAAHSQLSSYREAMLEHLLVGELIRRSWPKPLEVYKPQVDAVGIDLLLVCDGVLRAVQLKTSEIGAATSAINVHKSLWDRPGSCVIWTWFDADTLELKGFLWLGEPGQPLPPLEQLGVASHTKGNAQGQKAPRPALCVVPKRCFKWLTTVDELLYELFGPLERSSGTAGPWAWTWTP